MSRNIYVVDGYVEPGYVIKYEVSTSAALSATTEGSVAGIAERIVTGSGTLNTTPSFTGTGEREITSTVSLVSGNSTVTGAGAAGRSVVFGSLESGNSSVSGIAERTITANGNIESSNSSVSS